MKWKTTSKRKPKEGETVLCCWGIEAPGSMGVATFSGGTLWHEPDDDEDDFREPEFWMELPDSPFAAEQRSTEEKS